MPLADLPDEEKKQYAQVALKTVTTKRLPQVAAILATMLIENAKLLKDCQRLRQLVGEEPLPEFKL